MENYKISELFKNLNDSTISKLVTKTWIRINVLPGGQLYSKLRVLEHSFFNKTLFFKKESIKHLKFLKKLKQLTTCCIKCLFYKFLKTLK